MGEPRHSRDAGRDRAHFESLYTECFRGVYRYVSTRVRDAATAEDLTSEAFLRAWHKWPPREVNGGPARAWLFRIARNLVIDHYRAEARRPAVPLEGVEVSDGRENPGEDAHLAALSVRMGLAALPARDQDLLALRLAGLSNEEIAAVLGIRKKAAGMACLRALRRLREKVTGEG